MVGIKGIIHRAFQHSRGQIDSARMELDAVSIPSFERVVREAETLTSTIRNTRTHRQTQSQLRVVISNK